MKARELGSRIKRLGIAAGLSGVILLAFSACGGGGGASSTPHAGGGTVSSQSTGGVSISFTIPSGNTGSSLTRKSQTVPSSIEGVAVYAYSASSSQPSTPTLVGDLAVPPTVPGNTSLCVAVAAGRQCTISFSAPVGSDVISVALYNAEPVSGAIPASASLVASGMASLTVSANGTNSATLTLNSVAASFNGASGGSLPALTPTATATISGGNLSLSLPAGAVSGNVQVGVSEVLSLLIPLSTQRHPQYTAGAGNTMVYAFGITFLPAVTLSSSMTLTGTTFQIIGSLASQLSSSGNLSVAQLTGNTYTDVGQVTYTFSGGTLTITGGTAGIVTSGIFVIYIPAAGTVNTGSSSASSTGALAVLTVAGTTYAYVPTSSGLVQVALASGTSILSKARTALAAVPTPTPATQPVDACTADSVHTVIYCIQFSAANGANIYAYNVSGGSIPGPTSIPTNASYSVTFSGGSCVMCGIVYDGLANDLIVSTSSGYIVCPTSGSCATPTSSYSTAIAENFGYNASTRQLFSPYYPGSSFQSQGNVNLISLASGTSGVYTMPSPPSSLIGPDHGAIDVGTDIGVTTNECNSVGCGSTSTAQAFLLGLGSATLNSSNMTASIPIQPFTLTSTALSACPYATDGIAVDSNAHYAFFASEYCGGVIGVAKLPTSASGLTSGFSDWVFADMPAPPNSSYWSDNEDPHALTVFSLPGVCTDCAIISSYDKSYLALIDLNQFLSASRNGGDAHTVASSSLQSTPASGNPVLTFIWTGVGCQSACSSSRSPQGVRRQ
jgi:hypothetical protein